MGKGALAVLSLILLAGCASHRPRPDGDRHEEEWHAPVQMLLRFDANHDGSVTRAEMEAGLRADFAAADTNHDGVLEPDEVWAVNEKRSSEDASAASPLVDWNNDGVVDFDEFAATARSLFDQMDANGDGVLSPAELKPKGSGPGQGEKDGEPRGHGGRGGGHGGGGHGGGGHGGGGRGGGDDGDGQ